MTGVTMSLAEYHALNAIGSGRLTDFIASPALYFGRYEVDKDDPRHIAPDQSGKTRIGSMLHCLVLEGAEELERRYRPWRGGLTKGRVKKDGTIAEGSQKRTTNKNSEAYDEFLADCRADGIEPCDTQDIDHCEAIAAALYESDAGRLYLHQLGGKNEQTLLWNELGMACKARPDRIVDPPHRILLDLKSTGAMSLDEIQRIAIAKGYHRQAAWYSRGYLANFGEAPRHFVFLAVRTSKPYLVFSWEFSAEVEAVANAEIDMALAEILGRRMTGDWLPDECRRVMTMGIKPYQIAPKVADELRRRDESRPPSEIDQSFDEPITFNDRTFEEGQPAA